MDAKVSTHTFLTMIIEESVCFMLCDPIFFVQLFLCGTHGIYIFFFSSTEHCAWAIIIYNLPERVQILCHAHIICITVRENRIFCCQIFCDLLFKSAFERIFNVMQLILVKIKWKYLIKKFHDICLLYYFNIQRSVFQLYSGRGGPTWIATIYCHWKIMESWIRMKMWSFVVVQCVYSFLKSTKEVFKVQGHGTFYTCNPLRVHN
jgi:hypothetical protein